jgi:hypothetical protein
LNRIKQLTNVMFCKFLGVAKLTEKEHFPIAGDDDDEQDLPLVHGSQDVRQVRLLWNKSRKDPHNHKAIMKISQFAKSHGRDYVSEAASLLGVVTQGDLDQRFFKKYEALQKVWRGTSGRKTTKPGDGLTKNKRDNRARGVSRAVT